MLDNLSLHLSLYESFTRYHTADIGNTVGIPTGTIVGTVGTTGGRGAVARTGVGLEPSGNV